MMTYEHRQFSPWLLLVLALVAFALLRYGLTWPDVKAHLVAFTVATAICVAFIQLNTRVDSRAVSWAFTFGFPGGSIPCEDIADAQITKTRWWEGWGIHWTSL